MPKVLVVDDSVSVRKVVERTLVMKRIDVCSAASGKEAIEQIAREMPDLIVCDVIMPDMDGYQLCEFVKTHPRLGRTPVLLISGIVNSMVLERAAAVRSDEVMRKPFTPEELWTKIDSLLEGVRTLAPAEPSLPVMPSPAAAPIEAAPPPAVAPLAAAVPVEVPRPPAVASAEAPPSRTDLKTVLGNLAALPAVVLSVLVDREGFLIESAGETILEPEVAGALAACLAEYSEGVGRELRQGKFQSIILEYETGLVLVHGLDSTAVLAVVLRDPAVLGKIRYYVRKALPELLAAL